MAKVKKAQAKSDAMRFMEGLMGGPLTFGAVLASIRATDEYTLAAMATKLGVTRAVICDVEKGRRGVSADRAAKWAKALGYPPPLFVKLALQAQVNEAGLRLVVDVKAA